MKKSKAGKVGGSARWRWGFKSGKGPLRRRHLGAPRRRSRNELRRCLREKQLQMP